MPLLLSLSSVDSRCTLTRAVRLMSVLTFSAKVTYIWLLNVNEGDCEGEDVDEDEPNYSIIQTNNRTTTLFWSVVLRSPLFLLSQNH